MATDYKELVCWQQAVEVVTAVYEATRQFPADERFGLTNQLRRAAVSIPSNIAEGQGRRSDPEFIRFLRIANGSRQEVETQLRIATNLGFLDPKLVEDLHNRLEEIGRLIFGLIKSLL